MIKLKEISKKEAAMLCDKGYVWHRHIFKTHTRYSKYYCIEEKDVLRDLEHIRNSKVLKVVE